MSFAHQTLPINHLLNHLPIIEEIFPPEIGKMLCKKLKVAVSDENSAKNGKLTELIDCLCAHKPSEFIELVAYSMLSMALNMTKVNGSSNVQTLKNQLLFHTLQMPADIYCGDFKKIYLMAESLWSISSDTLSINYMISCINDKNRFTYNVSIALICGAFTQLIADTSIAFKLSNLNDVFTAIANTDLRMANDQTIDMLFRFLILFATFQSVYWFNFDRPALHPQLAEYMEFELTTIDIRSMLNDLKHHLNRSLRDGNFKQQQIMMSQLTEIVINDLEKMTPAQQMDF